jgi:hypothetical protein
MPRKDGINRRRAQVRRETRLPSQFAAQDGVRRFVARTLAQDQLHNGNHSGIHFRRRCPNPDSKTK